MKLVSVNVSLPIEIDYNNGRISTSIFKKPVTGKILVQAFSLIGDQQVDLENHSSGHKAIYAFSTEQYDYWRQTLERPELHYGQFGENLTISGLDESLLCIGDQLQIGDCVLEVSQPRIPCFKLGIALMLNTMPKKFIQHGHTGMYFKVLKIGSIKSGDEVIRIYQHPHQLSVKTLFKAYFDPSFIDAITVMKMASEINELSDEWRQKLLVFNT